MGGVITRFGEFELDGEAFELSRAGTLLDVQPRVLGLLLHLVRERDRLVTREELLEGVWADAHVEEASLYRAIAIARRLLEEGAGVPQPIRTVRGKGYRFVAPVQTLERARLPTAAPAPPGRADALAELRQALEGARAGERQLVVVSGEAGIGKTRLVDAFTEELRRAGGVELTRGQCLEPLGGSEPYSPLLEAVARLCRRSGSDAVAVLRSHAPSWLAQLPAVRGASEGQKLERRAQGATRERLTEELADALDELAAHRPLAIVLEDLHWCDRSTLGLLAALARRRERAMLLVVATARTGEPTATDAPLRRLLADLKTQGRCQEIVLQPLSEGDVREVARQRLRPAEPSPRLARWLWERSSGNPLFVQHLIDFVVERKLQGLGEEGSTLEAALESVGVPGTLAELIERQIEALDAGAVRLLEAAAAAGSDFSAAEVAAALGEELAGVEDGCDELARRSIFLARAGVTEWTDGALAARFRFRHALHRDALCARVPPARRRELHARIGRRLEQGHGARSALVAPLLARHFALGGDAERAVLYSVVAVEEAARRRAGHEARELAERALALVPLLAEAQREAQELALRFALVPALPEAVGYGDPAIDANLARAEWLCERTGDVERRLAVLWSRCHARYQAGEPDRALALAERLLADARSLALPAYEILAHDALAFSHHKLCRFVPSQEHAERVLALYDPERHRALAHWIGQDVAVDAAITSAFNLWYLGRPGEAAAGMDRAVEIASRSGHGYSLVLALCYAAAFHVTAEDPARAREAAGQAILRAREERLPSHRVFAELMRAAALPAAQERIGAMLAALRAFPAADETALRVTGTTAIRALFAAALAQVGQRELALAQVGEAFADVARSGERHQVPGLHLLRGGLVEGDAEVERELEESLEAASEIGHRIAELHAATELARVQAKRGLRGEALALLALRAEEMAGEPDVPVLQRARGLLRELGAG